MDNELIDRFKQIDIENNIFVVFLILILLAYYANDREKDYFINGNIKDREEYYYILVFVFLITVVISGYYVYNSFIEVKKIRNDCNFRKKEFADLSFIASIFAFLASFIFLYIAIIDTEIETEISL